MEILALLEKYLGQNDFNPAIAGLLNKRDSEYHLTFYKVVVNEDKIPKDEYEHMDKKLARINEFQRVLERDFKEFKRFITASNRQDADTEQHLKMARGIYTRMVQAEKRYKHQIGIHVADWRRLAKSRAIEQECIETVHVRNDFCMPMPTASRPSFPIGTGVVHYAINIRPRDCDVQLYSSHQAFQLVGSGHAHEFNFSAGVLKEVRTVQTYIS
jgi:hypothetical protein